MLVSQKALIECPVPFLGKLSLLLDPIHILAASLLPQHHASVVDRQSEPRVALGILLLPLVFWK